MTSGKCPVYGGVLIERFHCNSRTHVYLHMYGHPH